MTATDSSAHIEAAGVLPSIEAITSHLATCEACQRKLLGSPDLAKRIGSMTRSGGRDWKERRRYERIQMDKPASIRVFGPAPANRCSVVRILNSSREGLKLKASEFLRPGLLIQIYAVDTTAFGEVRYCKAMDSTFQAGVQIRDSFPAPLGGSLDSQRKDVRTAIQVDAELRIAGAADMHAVTILDVSKSGFRLRSKTMVPTGTRINLMYRNVTVSGETRYVRELGPAEFNIGVNAESLTEDDQVKADDFDLTLLFEF